MSKKSTVQAVSHERMLQILISGMLREHPLPWRVERGLSYEVATKDGAVIAQCPGEDEAHAIISFVEEWKRLSDKIIRDTALDFARRNGYVVPTPPLLGQPDLRCVAERVVGVLHDLEDSGSDAALRQAIADEVDHENDE